MEEIIETIIELKEKFEEISKKGYIKGIYNNYSAIGRTFEDELGLPRNEIEMPDYKGIEIKTRRTYSKSNITLFNAVPDGKEPNEMERIKETYGYPYKRDKKYKALYVDIFGNKKNFGGIKYQYKLEVDKEKQIILLCIYDKKEQLLEKKIYWSFLYLESKLMLKLQNLAIVNAWTNKVDNWNYFKYYKIEFYRLKSFEKFIELIERGIIAITLKIDIHLDEKRYGNTYDHGCGFSINEKDIPKLYYKYNINNLDD